MNGSRALAVVIVALIAGTAALTNSLAQPAAPAPKGIAVCDLVEVFNNYQRAKDLTTRLNERREAIKAEAQKRTKAVEALRLELDNYKKGSAKYKQTQNEIMRQSIERMAYLQFQDALALREHRDLTKEMYREIRDMVAATAKRRSVAVVLQREPQEIQTEDTKELLRQIHSRKLLYAAESLDITEEVLATLNRAYKSKAPAKPKP